MIENYFERKKSDNFLKQMETICSKDNFTLADYKQYVADSINDLKKGVFQKLINNQDENEGQLLE
jgi:hypothetical protein